MTYEDWWLEFTSVHPDWRYADSEALRKAAFESGAASRDAEIAELVAALERIGKYPRISGDELGYEGCRIVAREALAKVRKS